MPAATVIPAPLAYINVVAVKNLVGLRYERPFTREGNYVVVHLFCFKIFKQPKVPTTTTKSLLSLIKVVFRPPL